MGTEWQELAIGDVCTRVTSGGTPSRARPEYFIGGARPWVKTQELHDRWISDTEEHITDNAIANSSAKLLPAGTVLVAMYGATVGQLGMLAHEMTCNQACCALIVDETRADPRFVYYQLLATRPRLIRLANGAAQQNLSGEIIKRFRLQFPPLHEQRRIADTLSALDDKIELNRRMSQTLESMARALFKSWFVDFDPVRAKAQGRDPGLPPHIAALFPDSFGDSQLGEIPKGWHVRLLADVLSELETGSRPKGGVSEYATGIPSIGAESIVGLGVFDYSKTKYVPNEFFSGMSKGRLRSRDVLLYKDGGRPGEFEPHVTLFGDGFPFSTCAINEHVYRIRVKEELGQNLLLFWLSSDLVMEEMRVKGTGVAIPGLNSTQVKSLTALVPAREVAAVFNHLVEPWVSSVLATCNEARVLAESRDALLPKLISGEVAVVDRQGART
jgi:type I restriction enzyme S subunit